MSTFILKLIITLFLIDKFSTPNINESLMLSPVCDPCICKKSIITLCNLQSLSIK
jgi:hypothetical protein